jgi:sterol 3beta-glucosyltransferase
VRISMVTSGSRGDVQPLVVLADELRRRGHDIVLGVPPNIVNLGERAGLTTRAVGPDTQEFLVSTQGQRYLASGNVAAFTKALGAVIHDNAALLDSNTREVCTDADIIVAGSLGEHRAACVAEARGIPLVCVHYVPVRPTRAYPNMLVTTRSLPGAVNLATHALFQRMYWRSMREDINRFRGQLGLPAATASTATRLAAAGTLELQAYHAALVPALTDYPAQRPIIGFPVVGPDLRERLGETGGDPELDGWLADGEPPAYFGFGSMPVIDPDATMGMISRVADRLGMRALVGSGWSALAAPRGADDRIKVSRGVLNYDEVLPRCAVAVHHGGAGTVAAGVAAGIPTVVCSVIADNPFWGARIQELELGAHERFATLTDDRLEAAVGRALRPRVIERSRELGRVLRSDTDAARRGVDLIEAG